MAGRRRAFGPLIGAVTAAGVLTGCTGTAPVSDGTTVGAAPDAVPAPSTAPKPPKDKPACKPTANSTVTNRAAEAIQSLGWSSAGRFYESYSGLTMGAGRGRVVVYRIDNRALDRAARRIARSSGLCVDFVDAPISRSTMESLTRRIHAREPALEAAGAPLDSISRRPEGEVVVGVDGDVEAARRVLRDLDHVTVEFSRTRPA
jgi:hypothetical protein